MHNKRQYIMIDHFFVMRSHAISYAISHACMCRVQRSFYNKAHLHKTQNKIAGHKIRRSATYFRLVL